MHDILEKKNCTEKTLVLKINCVSFFFLLLSLTGMKDLDNVGVSLLTKAKI